MTLEETQKELIMGVSLLGNKTKHPTDYALKYAFINKTSRQ